MFFFLDYQTVNVLAYTRVMKNGSIDQSVVVLVNEATFAYFDQANKTFVLRPSASAGFSVLEDSDQSFCMNEVAAGFIRQTDYLEKLKQKTNSSKSLLGNLIMYFILNLSLHKHRNIFIGTVQEIIWSAFSMLFQ